MNQWILCLIESLNFFRRLELTRLGFSMDVCTWVHVYIYIHFHYQQVRNIAISSLLWIPNTLVAKLPFAGNLILAGISCTSRFSRIYPVRCTVLVYPFHIPPRVQTRSCALYGLTTMGVYVLLEGLKQNGPHVILYYVLDILRDRIK